MKKHLTFSNIFFVIALVVILYKPSRAWVIRQISFSPSVNKISESEKVINYNFQLKGLNSEDLNFNDLKGKVIFLNYWATWCPPCVAELPMIQKLHNDYKDKVVFLLVTSENWETISVYYKENGYDLPTYNLLYNPPNILDKSNSIPSTYVIDKNGFIRVYKTGAANWNSDSFRKELDVFLNE